MIFIFNLSTLAMGTLTKVAVEQEQAVERKAKVRVMSTSLSTALIVELSIFKLVMILVVFCQKEVFATSEKQQCEVFHFTLTSLWPHFEAVSESSLQSGLVTTDKILFRQH